MNYQNKYMKYKTKYITKLYNLYGSGIDQHINDNIRALCLGNEIIFNLINNTIQMYDGRIIYKLNILHNKPTYLQYIDINDIINDYKLIDYNSLKTIILNICLILDKNHLNSLSMILRNSINDNYIYIETFIMHQSIYGLDHIVKIENKTKTIYLLGEYHAKVFPIPDDTIISEGDFINNILQYAPHFIDFYIEQNILDKQLVPSVKESDIDYIRDNTRFQAAVLKSALFNCKSYPHVRCHFIDPRHSYMNFLFKYEESDRGLFNCDTIKQKELCTIFKYLIENHAKYMYTIENHDYKEDDTLTYLKYSNQFIDTYLNLTMDLTINEISKEYIEEFKLKYIKILEETNITDIIEILLQLNDDDHLQKQLLDLSIKIKSLINNLTKLDFNQDYNLLIKELDTIILFPKLDMCKLYKKVIHENEKKLFSKKKMIGLHRKNKLHLVV